MGFQRLRLLKPSKSLLKETKAISRGQSPSCSTPSSVRTLFLEGHRLVLDALEKGLKPSHVFLSPRAEEAPLGATLLNQLEAHQENGDSDPLLPLQSSRRTFRCFLLSEQLLSSISSTHTCQGVCAVFPYEEVSPLSMNDVKTCLVVCDGISDPGNMGTIIRSSLALDAAGVVLVEGCNAWAPKVLRSSMGSSLKLPVTQMTWKNLVKSKLPDCLQAAFIADNTPQAIPYYDCDLTTPHALILGSEAHGVSDEAHHSLSSISKNVKKIKIPIVPEAESLNVAVACGIILGEAKRQRSQKLFPQMSSATVLED